MLAILRGLDGRNSTDVKPTEESATELPGAAKDMALKLLDPSEPSHGSVYSPSVPVGVPLVQRSVPALVVPAAVAVKVSTE